MEITDRHTVKQFDKDGFTISVNAVLTKEKSDIVSDMFIECPHEIEGVTVEKFRKDDNEQPRYFKPLYTTIQKSQQRYKAYGFDDYKDMGIAAIELQLQHLLEATTGCYTYKVTKDERILDAGILKLRIDYSSEECLGMSFEEFATKHFEAIPRKDYINTLHDAVEQSRRRQKLYPW